jgi:alpha-L-rhamnosidase
MNSLNHYAYGAIGQWMYERIAGLASLAPGYQKIRIAPLPNTEFLTSASASVKTPYGKASSSWKIENDSFKLDVVIPPGTSAEVHIPYGNKDNLLENGSIFTENSNLKLMSSDDNSVIILAEPGTYNFQTKL